MKKIKKTTSLIKMKYLIILLFSTTFTNIYSQNEFKLKDYLKDNSEYRRYLRSDRERDTIYFKNGIQEAIDSVKNGIYIYHIPGNSVLLDPLCAIKFAKDSLNLELILTGCTTTLNEFGFNCAMDSLFFGLKNINKDKLFNKINYDCSEKFWNQRELEGLSSRPRYRLQSDSLTLKEKLNSILKPDFTLKFDVNCTITDKGNVIDIKLESLNEPIPKSFVKKFKKALSKLPFNPRYENFKPIQSQYNFQFWYYSK